VAWFNTYGARSHSVGQGEAWSNIEPPSEDDPARSAFVDEVLARIHLRMLQSANAEKQLSVFESSEEHQQKENQKFPEAA
jgi:hypothetical protein